MPSPFPGMNAYLEQEDAWYDFHDAGTGTALLEAPVRVDLPEVDREFESFIEIRDRRSLGRRTHCSRRRMEEVT